VITLPFRHPAAPPDFPEPAQLYGLCVLAFLLHVPSERAGLGWCVRCRQAWPCDHLRHAASLLDGF
jgi:hypothetical protein